MHNFLGGTIAWFACCFILRVLLISAAFLWYVWIWRTCFIYAFGKVWPGKKNMFTVLFSDSCCGDLLSWLPFLSPCLLHYCRRTVVSSKTKESKKVCTLYLERDALLSSSGSEQTWRVIKLFLQFILKRWCCSSFFASFFSFDCSTNSHWTLFNIIYIYILYWIYCNSRLMVALETLQMMK